MDRWPQIFPWLRPSVRDSVRPSVRPAPNTPFCGRSFSVTAQWIYSVPSSMDCSRPLDVHPYLIWPIWPPWAWPGAKKLRQFFQLLGEHTPFCGRGISVTAQWIYSILSSIDSPRPVGVHPYPIWPIWPIWAWPGAQKLRQFFSTFG